MHKTTMIFQIRLKSKKKPYKSLCIRCMAYVVLQRRVVIFAAKDVGVPVNADFEERGDFIFSTILIKQ